MRTTAFAVAGLAAAALALAVSGLGSGSGPSQRASLRLVATAPVAFAGRHFRSHERIRMTVTVSGARGARTLTASGRGSFVAAFGMGAGRCSAVRALAVGEAGSRAVVKRPPLPACLLQ